MPIASMHVSWDQSLSPQTSAKLLAVFQERDWIIDVEDPASAQGRLIKDELAGMEGIRFVIPLFVDQRLFGLIAINQPRLTTRLSWEDYDILKLISNQAAGFLALQHADNILSESQRLNTLNRVTAFVIHDVKTISAQLSLMVENAERHKSNPAFIEDMLKTADNAVERMQNLLGHLKSEADEVLEETPSKVMIHGLSEHTTPLKDRIVERFGDQIEIFAYENNAFLNIVERGVSKSATLAALLGPAGISLDQVVAFGDDGPDAEMLAACGFGVAMENASDEVPEELDLDQLIRVSLERFDSQVPKPVMCGRVESLRVRANPEKLSSVIGHTVQNAIDATCETGSVRVTASKRQQWAEVLIEDDGEGMDREFVENQLFQPFESTKGLTGMGIGAYQTREYIRSIGGDVEVASQLGVGTQFTLRLPLRS